MPTNNEVKSKSWLVKYTVLDVLCLSHSYQIMVIMYVANIKTTFTVKPTNIFQIHKLVKTAAAACAYKLHTICDVGDNSIVLTCTVSERMAAIEESCLRKGTGSVLG